MRFTFATSSFPRAWSRRSHRISPRFQSWRRWPRKNRSHRKPKLQPDRKSSPRRRKRAKPLLLLRVEKVLRLLGQKARRRLRQEKVLRLQKKKSRRSKSEPDSRDPSSFSRLWRNQFDWSPAWAILARSTRTRATISDSWLSIF